MKHCHRFFYPPAWPIAAKISVALVCAVLIPMLFTAYYNLQQSLNSVEAGEYRKLELLATSTASRFDQLIIDHHRVVAQISRDRHLVDFLAATTKEVQNSLHLGSQNYVFLIDQQGIIISHPDPSLVYHSLVPLKQVVNSKSYGMDQIQSLDMPDLQVMVGAKQPGHATYQLPTQIPQIVGFAPLATQPWVLGVSQSKAEFTIPLNRLIWLNSSSVVVVGGITAVIALLLGLSISRPIHALTAAAQALEYDDFDAHVLELRQSLAKLGRTQDDIGQLVRVFLEMAEEVRTRDQRLKMQVQQLRIEIDETKRASHVAEITENEHFQQLQKKIQKLKEHEVTVSETETEYYQRLQTQVQSLKERSLSCEVLDLSVSTEKEVTNN